MANDESNIALPVLQVDGDRRAGTRMGRRRAVVLVVVHVLVAIHVWWFMSHGSALSPLEPSEAGHSIRSGAINAGAIFLGLLILSILVFGRFFCGWACHVVAYQDAARWLLIKIGLRPKPVRARLLMLVPLFAVYWLFVRPLIARLGDSEPVGVSLHLTTTDFWATFPGLVISILTFLICGFVIVYFLGAKGFCTYGCPYGVFFYHSDKVAPGRIRVNEDCTHTGNCTKTCSSNVDVASEVARFGMVVDPGCMKCMDCVAGCPNDALRFGFGPIPAQVKREAKRQRAKQKRRAKRRRTYDFTWPEEVASVVLFAVFFAVFYNLYRVVPLLMAVGLCIVLTYLLLVTVQIVFKRDVSVQSWSLRRDGRVTSAGLWCIVVGTLIAGATVHSAVVQYHTRAGLAAYQQAAVMRDSDGVDAASMAIDDAQLHLSTVRRWGVVETRSVRAMLGEMARWRGDFSTAESLLQCEIDAGSRSMDVVLSLGLAQLAAADFDAAASSIDRAFDEQTPPKDLFVRADRELTGIADSLVSDSVRLTALELRIELLKRAVAAHPDFEDAAVQLCQLLVRGPVPSMRDSTMALNIAATVSEAAGGRNAMLLGMLAALQAQHGQSDAAALTAMRAAERAEALGDTAMAADMRAAASVYREMARQSPN